MQHSSVVCTPTGRSLRVLISLGEHLGYAARERGVPTAELLDAELGRPVEPLHVLPDSPSLVVVHYRFVACYVFQRIPDSLKTDSRILPTAEGKIPNPMPGDIVDVDSADFQEPRQLPDLVDILAEDGRIQPVAPAVCCIDGLFDCLDA